MRLAKHVYSGKGRKRPRLLLTRTHSSRRAVQQSSKAILPYQKNKAAYRRRTTQNCPVITIVESGLLLVRAIVQNRICQRNVRDFVYLCWNMTCPYVEQPNSVQPWNRVGETRVLKSGKLYKQGRGRRRWYRRYEPGFCHVDKQSLYNMVCHSTTPLFPVYQTLGWAHIYPGAWDRSAILLQGSAGPAYRQTWRGSVTCPSRLKTL